MANTEINLTNTGSLRYDFKLNSLLNVGNFARDDEILEVSKLKKLNFQNPLKSNQIANAFTSSTIKQLRTSPTMFSPIVFRICLMVDLCFRQQNRNITRGTTTIKVKTGTRMAAKLTLKFETYRELPSKNADNN